MTLALALFMLTAAPVQLEPPALPLGSGAQAALVLVVPGAKSVSAVSASGIGSLSATEKIADGRFRTKFTFPKERFPQLVLIRIEVEEENGTKSRRWAALPLIANADLKIETKPLATVTVTIGENSFGPAVANASGRVTIPAKVPPGFSTANVVAVDRAGNETTKPLELPGRPYPRVAGVLSAAEATTDGPVRLEIFAVEADGRPLADATKLRLSAKSGAFDVPTGGADGVFQANYQAKSAAAGADVITLGCEGTTAVTQLDVKLKAGAAAKLVITITPPTYTAGSGIPSRLMAQAVDSSGNAVVIEGTPQFTSDLGRIEPLNDGATLILPDDFGGRAQAQIRATLGGTNGEASLPLIAAAPKRADLTFPAHVAAGDTALGKLFVADAFGNPVVNADVVVAVSSGRKAAIAATGKGTYDVKLATEKADLPGEHQLSMRANGIDVGRVGIDVHHPLRKWAVSLGALGYVQTNFAQWVMAGPRVSVGLRLGHSPVDLVLEGTYGKFAPIREAQSLDKVTFNIDLEQGSLALGARLTIPFTVRSAFCVSVVGGAQRTWGRAYRTDLPASGVNETAWGAVIRASGGAAFFLGFGRVTTQLEFSAAPSNGVVRGNLGGLGLSLGYLANF